MTNQGQDRLPEILQVANVLAKKAASDDYLYRGEPECYERVSSSLYRKHQKIEAEEFDIVVVQSERLHEAKRFIRETDEDAILEQLQHFGYPTNQIDFTTDYNIALFFACYSKLEKDGRVILLDKAGRGDLNEPRTPENRVIAQKSVFVRPSQGFVEPSDTVVIPKDLKRLILEYLDKSHGVNAAALFNDIHGFIRYHRTHESAYAKFYSGLTQQNKGQDDKALRSYNRSIALNPRVSEPYNNRGVIHFHRGNRNRAIEDLNKAIKVDTQNSSAHYNRGLVLLCEEDWDNAESDLERAKSLRFDIVSAFSGRFVSVADFEQKYSVQLPDNIKVMLTPKH